MAEKALLRVGKGQLTPADARTVELLRERNYHIGDVLSAELRKPRNVQYHRLAHAFGQLCVENLDAFSGMTSHACLKRLQLESNVGCDEIALNFPGIGPCTYRVPRSLSFASMSQEQFEDVFRGMCRHVASEYWPGLEPEQVEEMAQCMVQAA